MALNSFFDLPKWQRPGYDTDAAGPVAKEVLPTRRKATRIGIAPDGEVEYKEEVWLKIIRNRNLDLSIAPGAGSRPPQLSNTIEVRCSKEKCNMDQTVVVASHPYGVDWFSASRFKPGIYQGRRRDTGAIRSANELKLQLRLAEDPQAVLEKSSFDPFETDKKELVARFLNSFERTPGGNITWRNHKPEGMNGDGAGKVSAANKLSWSKASLQELLESLLSPYMAIPRHGLLPREVFSYLGFSPEDAEPYDKIPPSLLWGLCENFGQCRNKLCNGKQAKEWVGNPERTLSNAEGKVKRPVYALKEEAVNFFHAIAPHAWEASVMKALAGVPEINPNPVPEMRRLVIDAVIDIYRSTMLNLAKRLRSGTRPVLPPADYEIAGPQDPLDNFDRFITAGDEEKKWERTFRLRSPNEVEQRRMFQAALLRLENGNAREIVETCGMLAAAAAAIVVPVELVTKLKHIARDRSNERTARDATYTLRRIRDLGSRK
ncbi:MAG TPA: hypothetical protein VFQ41_01575 [Candidatus Angelobacter sp.]|nr:hypothetical protein [Candidatus Angelobacter sp.]